MVGQKEGLMEIIVLPRLKCKRCGHEWHPRRTVKPKVCPKCKSPYWDRDYSRRDVVERRKLSSKEG